MILLIFGPPGAGKGVYGQELSKKLGLEVISTGDLLRKEIREQTEFGLKIKGILDRGELVPDDVIIEYMGKVLSGRDNVLLDGFPRTVKQAEALDKIAKPELVIYLNVPKEIIVKRLSARLVCEKCGASYNKITLKPKKEGICDSCGGKLYVRDDDKPEVIEKRFEKYEKETKDVLDFYKSKGIVLEVLNDKINTDIKEASEKIFEAIKKKSERIYL
ncbi:MAG: nucleoside monophosphate kinase [archaeon]